MNDFLSHTRTFELKNRVARTIKDEGWPMVMNVVIHRMNIDHIDRIIGMAHEMGAEYLVVEQEYHPLEEEVERAAERHTAERRGSQGASRSRGGRRAGR